MSETDVNESTELKKTSGGFVPWLNTFFKLKENGTTIKTEVIAGLTSFMTMSYIIVVNPGILSDGFGAQQDFQAILFSTVMISFFMSVVMGFLSNTPYAVAPGMGLNAYISYEVVGGGTLTYPQALGAIIIAGALLTIMSLTPLSSGVLKAIPKSLRFGLAAGIGIFLVFIGLQEAGIVVDNMATLVALTPIRLNLLLFLFGLLLTAFLMIKNIKGAFLIGIVSTSIIGAIFSFTGWGVSFDMWLGIPADSPLIFESMTFEDGNLWQKVFEKPDASLFFVGFTFKGLLKPALLVPIFTLAFTDLFDSVSTFIGVLEVGGLLDEDGNPKNFKRVLIADSLTTMMSGFFGTSDATTYIESAAGVEQGGRSGLTAIITGLCFLPFMFFSPLIQMIPYYATSPVLVLLGVLMFRPITKLDWTDLEEAIPTFISIMMIPLTYSITYGIVFGILTYVFIKIIVGKIKEINVWLWATFAFALFALFAPAF